MKDIKRLTKTAIRSHKAMRKYYEDSISWGRGSEDKINMLIRVMKSDSKIAIDEINSKMEEFKALKEVLEQFNFTENHRAIDSTDIIYNKETGALVADTYGIKFIASLH